MTVKVTRPPINLREKLNEVDKISLENFKAMDATFSGNVSIGKNVSTAYLTSVKLNIHGSNFTYVRVSNDGYTGLDIGQADASEGGAGLIKLRDNTPLVFYTADLERMRIDASGNVNIYGTDNRPLAITSFNTASAGAGWDLDATSINGVVTVSTGGSERMRIDSVGTTTIKTDGTTQLVLNRADASIQSGNQIANLLITGDDPSAGQSGAAIAFTAGDAWATNSYPTNIIFYNDNSGTLTPRMTIDSSGNVGIGEINPVQKFQISADAGAARMSFERTNVNTTGGIGSIQWNALDGHAVAGVIAYGGGDDEGAHLVFNTTTAASSSDVYVSTTERMRITSGGALQLADVNSPNDLNCSIFSNSDVLELEAFGTNGEIAFSTGSSVTERMRIDASGNVGIGQAPDALFHVIETDGGAPDAIVRIQSDDTINSKSLLQFLGRNASNVATYATVHTDAVAAGTNAPIVFSQGASEANERMRIDENGNVGIGTDDPQRDAKLDVNILDETYTNAHSNLRLGSRSSSTDEAALTFATTGQALQGTIFSNYGYDNDVAYQENALRPSGYISFSNGLPNTGTGLIIFGGSQIGSTTLIEHAQFNPSGNLQFADGKGIDFSALTTPATTGTATGNVLNDYEEGSFIPTIATSGSNVSYSSQLGSYTKIGRVVHFSYSINLNVVTSQGSGTFELGGLPFASASTNINNNRYVCQTYGVDFDSSKYQFYAYTPSVGATTLRILYTTDNGAWVVATVADFAISDSDTIVICGTYFTD